jgi:thiamine transporter ThiT
MNPLRGASYAAILGMIISLLPALAGAWFAIRPSERLLSYMRPLSLAGIFAALCTISLGMTNGAVGLSRQPRFSPEMLLGGIAEVFAAAAVSFAFLTVAWICVAIGMRRHGAM